jgi:methyl-accepting chemotaxis protein
LEVSNLTDKIQNLYLDYTKIKPIIKKTYDQVMKDDFSKEYYSKNMEITRNLNKYDNLKKEIEKILNENRNNSKLEPYYSKLSKEFKSNDENYKNMIISIERKCQNLGINLDEEEKNQNFKRNDTLTESIQIGTGKLIDRKKMLEERDQELRKAQEVAAQIKDVAIDMNQKVQKDNEAFDAIEENVDVMTDNIDSAVKDIKEIQESQKDRGKCICKISVFIILVVVALGLIVYALIYDKIKKS